MSPRPYSLLRYLSHLHDRRASLQPRRQPAAGPNYKPAEHTSGIQTATTVITILSVAVLTLCLCTFELEQPVAIQKTYIFQIEDGQSERTGSRCQYSAGVGLSLINFKRHRLITHTTDVVTLLIYIDSFLFIVASATIRLGFGINTSHTLCDLAILFCALELK